MKELFRERDSTRVGYFETILRAAGIETLIKNQHASSVHIDIPEFWPALCVVNDDEYPKALEVLRELREKNLSTMDEEVACPKCNETNPGNFASCWSCGEPLAP